MDDGAAAGPVSVHNAQAALPLHGTLLESLARCGADCLALIRERYLERVSAPGAVSVVLLNDAEMARVHGAFLDDPSPTDVITFPYGAEGEILIGVETAQRQADEFGAALDEELALYLVHGLLHLCGYEDVTESGRAEMKGLQEELVAASFRSG